MKSGRHSVSTHAMAHLALLGLVAMTLAFSAACRADDAAAASDATAEAQTPRVSHHRPLRRLTAAQSIDQSVRRLSRGLNLNLGQQVRLRQILVDQQRATMQLRSRGAGVSGDLTGAMLAIYDQTKTRIRAMLDDEQKKKYSADVPREQTAPAQADLQHWLELQESRRAQDSGASQ